MNWRDIAQWNQIDPNGTLFVGASLYLYDAKPEAPKAAEKPDSYVVQSGDSLTNLASRFDLSLKQLADYNDLSVTDGLFVGQKLTLIEPKIIAVQRNRHHVQLKVKLQRLKKLPPNPIRSSVVNI